MFTENSGNVLDPTQPLTQSRSVQRKENVQIIEMYYLVLKMPTSIINFRFNRIKLNNMTHDFVQN